MDGTQTDASAGSGEASAGRTLRGASAAIYFGRLRVSQAIAPRIPEAQASLLGQRAEAIQGTQDAITLHTRVYCPANTWTKAGWEASVQLLSTWIAQWDRDTWATVDRYLIGFPGGYDRWNFHGGFRFTVPLSASYMEIWVKPQKDIVLEWLSGGTHPS